MVDVFHSEKSATTCRHRHPNEDDRSPRRHGTMVASISDEALTFRMGKGTG
jgi:hypothetical protein